MANMYLLVYVVIVLPRIELHVKEGAKGPTMFCFLLQIIIV